MPMMSFACVCILTSSLTSGAAKFSVMWAFHNTMILYGESYQTWNASAVWENLRRVVDGMLVLLYCDISSGSFTNMDDAPLPGGSHVVDFIAERTTTPSGANGDAREARMTRRSHPHQRRLPPTLWRCLLTKRISESDLPETQTRWSPRFSPIACLVPE